MYQPQRRPTTTVDTLASELEMTEFRAQEMQASTAFARYCCSLVVPLARSKPNTTHPHGKLPALRGASHAAAQNRKGLFFRRTTERNQRKGTRTTQRGPLPPPRNKRPIIARKLTTKLETACSFPPALPASQVHASRSTSAPTPSSPPSRQIRRYRPTLL